MTDIILLCYYNFKFANEGVVHIKLAIPFTDKSIEIKTLPSRITDPRYWTEKTSPLLWSESSFKNSSEQLKAYTGWVGDCVSLIAERVASIPLRLYNQKNELIEDHPFYDLMKNFNPDVTEFGGKELRSIYRNLTGECYILMAKDSLGIPRELYFRKPDMITPKVKNGIIDHYVYLNGAKEIIYPREDILFWKFPSPTDPFRGASPVQRKAYAYDTDKYNMIYQLNVFKNGAHLKGVLETEKGLSEEQVKKYLKIFNDTYGGAEKAHKTGALVGGFTYKNIGITNKDMEFMALAKWSMQQIASAYHTPPQKLSHPEQTNLANMKALDVSWNRECILPRCVRDAEVFNIFLIPLYKEKGLYCKYDNPVPADEEFLLKKRESRLKTFVMTPNEARKEDGLDEVPWGKVPLAPMNIMPLDSGGGGSVAPKPAPGKAIIEKYTDEYKRKYWNLFIKRVAPLENNLKRAIIKYFQEQELEALRALRKKKSIVSKDIDDVLQITHSERQLEKLIKVALPRITEMVKINGTAAYAELGVAGSFDVTNPKVIEWIKERVGELIKRKDGKSLPDVTLEKLRKTLAQGVANGEKIPSLASRVSAVYDEGKGYRAVRIARTETIASSNQGALQAYDQSGVIKKKEWIAESDACDICLAIEARGPVKLHNSFSGGFDCPPAHPNCRCAVLPVIEKD